VSAYDPKQTISHVEVTPWNWQNEAKKFNVFINLGKRLPTGRGGACPEWTPEPAAQKRPQRNG
jgi:hypothetical protein